MKNKKQKQATPVVKKTISLPEEVFRNGEKRAEEDDRNFSNYVARLIKNDVEAAQPA